MQILIVSVAEAQERLPELIARVASGDQVVIHDDGRSVATLGKPPMFPTTPEEVAATRCSRENAVRDIHIWREAEGQVLPEGMTVQDLLDEHRHS